MMLSSFAERCNHCEMKAGPAERHLCMQEHPEYATLRSTLQHLIRTQGVSGLWAGIVPRAGRISCAVIILQGVRSKLIALAEQLKGPP